MIYVICFTQLLTVGAFLGIVYLGREYLQRHDEIVADTIGGSLRATKEMADQCDRTVREVVAASDQRVQDVIKQAHREREMLIERHQFPEQMRAAAPAVDREGSVSILDEEQEFDEENPEAPSPDEDEVVTAVQPIRPVMPKQARGAN